MQPTVIFDSAASQTGQSSQGVSRAKICFIAGTRQRYSGETSTLLHSRLTAAAVVIAAVQGALLLGNLIGGYTTLWWLRVLILLVLLGAIILLRQRRAMSLLRLRILELVVFGSVAVQMSIILLTRLAELAAQQDAVSLNAVRQQQLTIWCILIFLYGTLILNTWKRGAAIMIPTSFLPYALIAVQSWLVPEVAALLAANKATSPLPFALVAAFAATYSTHVINSARREAFKARQFGQYRLLDRLGAGGMGEVYRAEHVLLKRPCAIKLIKVASETDTASLARFEKEVKTTAKLTHWNTVEIYDYGRTEDGTFYYVMELLPGMSLEDLVEQYGPLPAARVVHLLRQICGALQEAHSVGLIHRDIKPANIFASQRGGVYDVAKLLDFGLVKEAQEKSDTGEKLGSFSGTPLYMSPEQASAYEDVDGRADLYSLGAVAYYLLTGQTPFTSKNVVQLLAAHREKEVSPPSQLNSAIPADLEQIVLKCMAKQPADRYQDANRLMAALGNCSVANGWGTEQAAAWWQNLTKQPDLTQQPDAPVKAVQSVEATMDYQPDEE